MPGRLLGPSIRAVFFDAVGTVIHPDPPAPTFYAEVGRRHGSQRTGEEIRACFRAAFRREEVRDQEAGLRTSEAREWERWRSIVGAVFDDMSDCEGCFAELFEHYSRPTAWRCDPDAAETIRGLAERGFVLGLASNYDQRLRRVVAGLQALRPLAHLVISSEVGWRKPAPEFFAAVCAAVELPPEQIVLVGDDVVNDYEGARAAGLQAILFTAGKPPLAQANRQITRLRELLGNGRANTMTRVAQL